MLPTVFWSDEYWVWVLSNGPIGFCPGALAVAIQITTSTQKAKKPISTTNAIKGAIRRPGKFIIHCPASSNNADKPDSLLFKKYTMKKISTLKVND